MIKDNPLAWVALGFATGYFVVSSAPQKPCRVQPPSDGGNAFQSLMKVCDTVDNASRLLEPMAQGYVPSPYDLIKYGQG
jgi:hypothetical protein